MTSVIEGSEIDCHVYFINFLKHSNVVTFKTKKFKNDACDIMLNIENML